MRPVTAYGARWFFAALAAGMGYAAGVEELIARGNYSGALPVLEAARDAAARAGRHDREVAAVLNNLGSVYDELGRPRDAQAMFERSLALRRDLGESDSSDAARTVNNLGAVYLKLGLLAKADEALSRAAALDKKSGSDLELAKVSINRGMVYQASGRWDDAEHAFRQALDLRERQLGPRDPEVGIALNNLGVLLQSRHRLEEAEPLLERAVDTWEAAPRGNRAWIAAGLNNLGVLYTALGRLGQAEQRFQQAIRVAVAALPADHPNLASYRVSYAHLLRKLGRKDEARRLEESARASRERYRRSNFLGMTVEAKQLKDR